MRAIKGGVLVGGSIAPLRRKLEAELGDTEVWQQVTSVTSISSGAYRAMRVASRPRPKSDRGTWVPGLSVSTSLGLLLVVLAYAAARAQQAWWDDPLYWAGLLLMFVPLTVRLLGARAERIERITLVTMLGMGLYLLKVLRSPLSFELHDEFLHYRTAANMLHSGRLFGDNPLLPISAVFPGMEIVSSTLARVSGLSIFASGIILLALARLVLVLGLYLLYEKVSGASRVAGIATLIYMLNPKFIFFDAQFSYESLALPLVALILYAMVYRSQARLAKRLDFGLLVVAILGLAALVTTHHLTSYALVLFLILWGLFHLRRLGASTRGRVSPIVVALLGVTMCVLWLRFVAPMVIQYLAPSIQGGFTELLGIVDGRSAAHQIGQSATGQFAPLWERTTEIAATGMILLGMPFGVFYLWRYHRTNSVALALGASALAYPATLPFRLTIAGAEAADRAAGMLYIALAFVLAVGITEFRPMLARYRRYIALLTVPLIVIFVGNVMVGVGPSWSRLPGPYLVSADSRSIDPQSLDAASWTLSYLGPDNRIATDRVNGLIFGAGANQYPVAHVNSGVDVSPLFVSLGFGPVQLQIIKQEKIRYVVVDTRLSTGLPMEGIYFEAPEAGAFHHTTPIALAALMKYTRLKDVSLVFDGGSVLVFKIGAAPREP